MAIPLVTAIIPAYNRASLIKRAISSVQNQGISKIEIIVVDDGSTDKTVDVVKKCQADDPRIKLIAHETNKGEAGARNTGVQNANGTYIAFLDSDDEWLPNTLQKQVTALESANDSIIAVIGKVIQVSSDGTEKLVEDWTDLYPITEKNLLSRGGGLNMGNTLVIRTGDALSVGPFDEDLPIFVDLDWLCRLTQTNRILKTDAVVAKYHKAPMRPGEFLETGVLEFKRKNRAYLRRFPLSFRAKIEAQFYNHVSSAYAENGPWRRYVRTRFLCLLLAPNKRIGNYVDFGLRLFGFRKVGGC